MQKIIEDLSCSKSQDTSNPTFNFFLVKVFRLQKKRLDNSEEEPEFAVKLIDISQKILFDSIAIERKYMAYMNSTVSHEMRNPLNSINS